MTFGILNLMHNNTKAGRAIGKCRYKDWNILFICGGAFIGLDTIVEQRFGQRTVGFISDTVARKGKKIGEILNRVEPEDMIRYGLIPEFVGRMPVVAGLDELDEVTLIKILTEPKNALVKQYQKLLSFENVRLKFTEGALSAIAKKAIQRKTGARGLRSILEQVMLEVMYEIPSQKGITECLVTEETIVKNEKPILLYEKQAESA
jgi:ATP-dependent Clp protease ATP-binding subunit ClpX